MKHTSTAAYASTSKRRRVPAKRVCWTHGAAGGRPSLGTILCMPMESPDDEIMKNKRERREVGEVGSDAKE